jgi:hypothetical protein
MIITVIVATGLLGRVPPCRSAQWPAE